jgi:hypothetical protein
MPRFFNDWISISLSLMPIERPTPSIGDIRGEINMAPIIMAAELVSRPIEASIAEHINIQVLLPLTEMLSFTALMVPCSSVCGRISKTCLKRAFISFQIIY